MFHLISNAIKFSHPGTVVEVGLGRVSNRLEFYFRDEGLGIPEEDQSRLFTEFPKINVFPTGGERSIGLGLAIVKKIVDAHGGSIHVDSKEGKGSAFHVRLPEGVI